MLRFCTTKLDNVATDEESPFRKGCCLEMSVGDDFYEPSIVNARMATKSSRSTGNAIKAPLNLRSPAV
jgi:hypothetical protein